MLICKISNTHEPAVKQNADRVVYSIFFNYILSVGHLLARGVRV